MIKVAITGNIASGKSTAEKYVKTKGFSVLDTDEVAHKLLTQDSVKKSVTEIFKDYDISENGEISRPKLGKIIFNNPDLKKELEEILHPLIKEEIRRFFNACESEKITFVSVPLLFEAKFESLFDKVILICADDQARLERLIKRSDLTIKDAENRLKSQISQDEKTSMADYVIYNDSSINDLYNQINKILFCL